MSFILIIVMRIFYLHIIYVINLKYWYLYILSLFYKFNIVTFFLIIHIFGKSFLFIYLKNAFYNLIFIFALDKIFEPFSFLILIILLLILNFYAILLFHVYSLQLASLPSFKKKNKFSNFILLTINIEIAFVFNESFP